MGLRRIEFTRRDLSRVFRRLTSRSSKLQDPSSKRPIPNDAKVVSPWVIPRHAGITAKINRFLLRRQLRAWRLSPRPTVLWSYTPVTYDLFRDADATVYHCVDLLAEFPGIDKFAFRSGEKELSHLGVSAVASSEVVAEHLREQGFTSVSTWPNVADVETYLSRDDSIRIAGRVVFAGNLSANKVDSSLIIALAESGFEVVLAGPISQGGGDETILKALRHPRIQHVGMLQPDRLSALYSSAVVGIIPYLHNRYTRGVSPLKTFEYLAAGLSVVSTSLPGVVDRPGHVWTADTHGDFIDAVRKAADAPSAQVIFERQAIARQHSWSGRRGQIHKLVQSQLRPSRLNSNPL